MFGDVFAVPFDRQLWFVAIVAWTLVWKGLAMWKSAKKGSKPWFIVFLIVNTLGILEILYLYVFSQPRPKTTKKSE